MSNFANTEVDLNTQKIGNTKLVEFKLVTDNKVTGFQINCDCLLGATYDPANKRVYLNFNVGDIPQHLKQMGINLLPRRKEFYAIFEDGAREKLIIKYSVKA